MFYLEKIQEKQGFSTSDMLMSLAGVIAIMVIVLPIVIKKSSQQIHNEAMYRAHNISIELAKEFRTTMGDVENRGIASLSDNGLRYEGIAGTDPWGNPYHFRVLKDIYGHATHLVVWSWGSNARRDTDEYAFNADKGQVQFHGDDLGYILRLGSSKS